MSMKITQRVPKLKPNLSISIESLNEIQAMAKMYEVDPINIEVKEYIDVVEKMLNNYLEFVMKRDVHEVIESDVDKLLASIAKLDKKMG